MSGQNKNTQSENGNFRDNHRDYIMIIPEIITWLDLFPAGLHVIGRGYIEGR